MTKLEQLAKKLSVGWDAIGVREAIALIPAPKRARPARPARPGLTVRQRAILQVLVAHANTERMCFVSVRTLAAVGLNKDTVGVVLAELRSGGLIATRRTHGAYAATTFDLQGLPAALLRRLSEAEGQDVSEAEGQDVSEAEGQACPKPRDTANLRPPDSVSPQTGQRVPSQPVHVSDAEGHKQDLKQDLKQEKILPDADSNEAWGFPPEPLVLETTKPEPESKASRRRAQSATPKRTPEEHAAKDRVVAAHVAIVLTATGTEPAEEHSAAWKLLDAVKGNADEAERRIREAVGRGEFGTTSLAKIAGKPNDYIPRRNGSPKRVAQISGSYDADNAGREGAEKLVGLRSQAEIQAETDGGRP